MAVIPFLYHGYSYFACAANYDFNQDGIRGSTPLRLLVDFSHSGLGGW
jgi:hypothetical protein